MDRILVALLLALFLQPVLAAETIDGYWQNESGLAHLKARPTDRGFSFEYVTDGAYRCEVPGIAERGDEQNTFVFRNERRYWLHPEGNESYGTPEENGSCSLTFTLDSNRLTVKDAGNCKSFCGVNGSLGAQLTRIQGRDCFNAGDNYRVRNCVVTSHSASEESLAAAVKRIRDRLERDTRLFDDAQTRWLQFASSECEVRAVSAQNFANPEMMRSLFLLACTDDLNAERLAHLRQISLGCDSCLQ